MERNVGLVIAYDGTDFHGWQAQPALRTVQGLIEQGARRVVRHQVEVIGSGRTDAGVHAAGQVANFLTGCTIPAVKLRRAIGARMPKDISIVAAFEAPAEFHALRSALSKLYRYRIHNAAQRPALRLTQRQTYHFWQPLDIEAMRRAASHLIGTMDFSAMASKGGERQTMVRTVLRCEVERCYEEVHISVEGRGFLYNQVRNMVGTLIEVGRGHWEPDRMAEILAGRDRSAAGPTAPARGLCLRWVRYPPGFLQLPGPPMSEARYPAGEL
jgi:tRNA pseudouridine38-40 synthase